MKKIAVVGFSFGILASFFGVFTGVAVKWVGHEIPTVQLLFIRFLFGFVFLLPIVLKKEGGLQLSTSPWSKHLLRTVLGLTAMVSCYYAIAEVSFIDYVVLGRLYPFIILGCSLLLLKEKASANKILAAVLAVVGSALAVKPDLSSPPLYILMIVFGVFVSALGDVVVKQLTRSESCEKIILCFFGIGAVLLAFLMPFFWVTPTTSSLVWPLLVVGVSGTLSQYFVTKAYTLLNAGTVGVISSSQLIWAVAFGAGIWHETMDYQAWLGLFVIVLSTFLGILNFSIFKKPKVHGNRLSSLQTPININQQLTLRKFSNLY